MALQRPGVRPPDRPLTGYVSWDKIFDFYIPPPFDHYELLDLGLSTYPQLPHL